MYGHYFGEYVRSLCTIRTYRVISLADMRNHYEKVDAGTVHPKNIFLSLRNILAKIIILASLDVVEML
jgi:hypothetical protein